MNLYNIFFFNYYDIFFNDIYFPVNPLAVLARFRFVALHETASQFLRYGAFNIFFFQMYLRHRFKVSHTTSCISR